MNLLASRHSEVFLRAKTYKKHLLLAWCCFFCTLKQNVNLSCSGGVGKGWASKIFIHLTQIHPVCRMRLKSIGWLKGETLQPHGFPIQRHFSRKVMRSEEGLFVSHPNSPSWLANMPPHSKDVFGFQINKTQQMVGFCVDKHVVSCHAFLVRTSSVWICSA